MKPATGVLCLILFLSCSEKPRPAAYLSQTRMREIMWDMIRADQYVSDYLLKDSSKNRLNESVKLYDEIFRLHHVTKKQFSKSYNYYTSRPDLFRPIIDSLAKRKEEHVPFFDKPGKKFNKDSLIKAHSRIAK